MRGAGVRQVTSCSKNGCTALLTQGCKHQDINVWAQDIGPMLHQY